jgi:hypothetical protein
MERRFPSNGTNGLFIIVLIFLLIIPQNAAAQNDFPIGLQLEYEIENRYGFNSNTNTKSFDFIRWTDAAQTTVELQIDSEVTVVPFPEGEISVVTGAPLWTDFSDWHAGELSFQGRTWEVSVSIRNGHNCWHLHTGYDGPDTFDGEYWNLFYEGNLGILVFYGHIVFSSYSTSEFSASLEESNLSSFKFLGGLLEAGWLMPLLISGITVELTIIVGLVIRRVSKN